MNRRDFFRNLGQNTRNKVVEKIDTQVRARRRWIRPPFALDELEFLLACTRCNDCIDACSYQVIFPLAVTNGTQVAHTPALDLINKGCHLCADWPCVQACSTGALQQTQAGVEEAADKNVALTAQLDVPLAHVWIDVQACLPYQGPECGACINSCPIPEALCWDTTRPYINEQNCVGCGLCREACITQPKSILVSLSQQEPR